jgi:hypothetical protein
MLAGLARHAAEGAPVTQPTTTAASAGEPPGLELNEEKTLRALSFVCNVPGDGTGVVGYRAKICQLTEGCFHHGDDANEGPVPDPVPPDSPLPGGNSSPIQTSGVECTPETASGISGWLRTESGMKNNGSTSSAGTADTACSPRIRPVYDELIHRAV